MWRGLWLRLERCFLFNLIRLFRIRGASERVARGFALGLVVNFLPTFGFGVVVSGFLARVLGGNMMAGLAGGGLLSFAWPLLFYFNIRIGGLLFRPPLVIDEPEDITRKTIDALVWGKTFLTGALINSLVAGLITYFILRLIYEKIRPSALAYFRHHAREHQKRFARPKGNLG